MTNDEGARSTVLFRNSSFHLRSRQSNALILLVEGEDKLTKGLQPDVPDVAECGINDRGIGEFVPAQLDHVFQLDLFNLHFAGEAPGSADDARLAGKIQFLGQGGGENESADGVAGIETGVD